MPLTRYQIRNGYSLADPELYRAADKDDPEALLEGVAMAGLIGVLRQLGDLAEFAAEMFHDLHEEVMATATRGHGLMVRVQQLEAEFPSIEKAFLSQTSHSLFFSNTGSDWHPNIRMEQNLIAQGDLPRFVMDSYEECRGPPRLFLLDKFDVAGAGACLKRYTDPSFFKVDSSSSGMMNADVQREKKTRKAKKKGSRWRNGETPEVLPTSHAKLHQLFLEERVESHINDPARHVKLKRGLNGFPFDSKTMKSYMENFLKSPTPDHNVVSEISDNSSPLKLPSNITGVSGIEILEISRLSPEKESLQRKRSSWSSPDVEETGRIPSMDELSQEADYGMSEVPKTHTYSEADTVLSTLHEEVDEKEVMVDGGGKIEGSADGYQSDDIASEVENYMDAHTTMDSEMETDTECRAKNGRSFLNIKNHGIDSVANEEQQDLQAHFSDSQSIGDSTATADGNSSSTKGISSLSYSDTLSNLIENTPSDGDMTAEILPSTKICEAKIVNMLSDRCLVNGESPLIQPLEHMFCNGVCIEEAEIPRYRPEFGEPSASSCLTDSSLMLLPVDPGTSLAEGASMGPELDEISSDHNEFNTGHIHPEENRTYMGDQLPSTSNLSDVSCQTRDDFLPELSADNHPADELDDEDLHILLHASLHLSNILEVAPAKESSEILLDDVLQAKYAEDEDECTKISVDSQIDSPHSVASHTKEKPLDSALPELETCDPQVEPDSIVSEVDDAAPLSGEKSIISTSLVDSPQASNFTKQQFSEITENVSSLEPDSAEVAFSYPAEKNPYGAFNSADGEKFCGFSSDRNMVGKDAAELQFPSDFQNSPDPPPVPKVHVLLDDVVTETIHSEAVVVATAVAGTRCDDSEDESISSLHVLHQNGLEIGEACSPGHLQEFGTEKEVDQQAVASSDLDLVMCNAVPYDDSKSELLNNVPDSSIVAISRNSLHIVDAITVPLSSDKNDQDSESKSPKQINVIENTEDAISSPSHHIAELRTRMEQKFDLQADQYDVESLHAGKESSEPFFQVERIQSPDHLDQEQHTDSSYKYCAAHLPSQPSVAEFLPQVYMSEQATDPSSSILPFGLLPEASQINLDGMPPLPPLPPVQWRIGKVQHASLAPERDLVQHNLDPFPQILASAADEKARLGHVAIDGEITQPSNPFFLLSAVKEENSQHGYENLAGCMVHSTPLSLQVPTMVSHGRSEDDFPSSGRTQSMNPFLALPTVFNAKSQNGFLASEGGTSQPSLNPFSPVTNVVDTDSTYPSRYLQETLIQPLHQSAPKMSSEDEKLRGTSVISEGKVVNPPKTTFPPPVMQDDQPQHVFSTSEGETAWLSSASVPLAPFEGGKPNGNRQMKLPRPRNPLIDAVIAHDKSKLRKVTERLRPQIGHEVDERDSLLEQIRAKSFNLKPAVMTRPSIQGPKTNLKVSAILEKANAIRQALAGSDEDDDADGWSDS